MRLIYTLEDQAKGYALSTYLTSKGVENQLEITNNNDWGSPDYGTMTCKIWVYDEDQVDEAMRIVDEFQQNPDDPRYYHFATDVQTQASENTPPITPSRPVIAAQKQPLGKITLFLVLACSMIFFISSLTSPSITGVPRNLPYTPILSSQLNKEMMFDYPKAYSLVDKLVTNYGLEALQDPESLPLEGQRQLQQFEHTPYWKGVYEKVVNHFIHPDAPWNFQEPMFEKIRQGEFWRLFSPIFLHYDIFHLFFNMIWLVVLGKQLEQHLGKKRYILFILFTALFSNVAQYLMSGPNFLGFSGVLCAMIVFIWYRQKHAAWEGYYLQPGTITFIAFFILFMFALQVASFFLEISINMALPIGIANTAHLVGAFSGYLLARLPYFSWK